ncbi:MAG: hypothetical protein KGZ59_03405 [Chitinophagaceae bacterium]|nr:hypothetical protein [Chitinophagaceae bacterium]
MKKIIGFLLMILLSHTVIAQEEQETEFKRWFAGGSIVLGFAGGTNSQFTIGANPEIGYSLSKNFDAGICFNTIYSSLRYNEGWSEIKQNTFNFGIGLFTRLHLGQQFFIQLQPELNTINYKITDSQNPNFTNEGKLNSTSLLAGIGYGTRIVGQTNFFTVILVDLRRELYSPYRSQNGDIVPVIRGGFNFYFGKKR